jgi:hypothetical protein
MAKQIVGWCLVALGLGIILWVVGDSYKIFTGQKQAPAVFKLEQSQTKSGSSFNQPVIGPGVTQQDLQKQMQEQAQGLIQEQIGKMIPSDAIAKILNMISWSIFAGILILAGGKVAGIGTGLLKNEVIKTTLS